MLSLRAWAQQRRDAREAARLLAGEPGTAVPTLDELRRAVLLVAVAIEPLSDFGEAALGAATSRPAVAVLWVLGFAVYAVERVGARLRGDWP